MVVLHDEHYLECALSETADAQYSDYLMKTIMIGPCINFLTVLPTAHESF